MPQFDIAWFPSQIFWLLISFLILYTAMRYFLLPPLQEIIQKREQKIQSILRQADKLNAEADKIIQSYQAYINEATAYSAQIVQTAHNDISSAYSAQENILSQRLQSDSAVAEKEVRQQRASVLEELGSITTQFIQILMNSVYGLKPKKRSLEKTVSSSIKEQQKWKR